MTAIDYTEEMLKKAKNNAGILADKIEWYQMDAQALRFADNTFDMIVSRNVTWNLEHPDRTTRMDACFEAWRRSFEF